MCHPYVRPSNILADLQKLLEEFQVKAKIYSYWIWISQIRNDASIHYELNMSKSQAERLISLISHSSNFLCLRGLPSQVKGAEAQAAQA